MYKETLTSVLRILQQFSVSTVGETHGAAVLILALMGGARILACRRRRHGAAVLILAALIMGGARILACRRRRQYP